MSPEHSNYGVHLTHCCPRACKYGDDDCPVALGEARPVYPCDDCDCLLFHPEQAPNHWWRSLTLEQKAEAHAAWNRRAQPAAQAERATPYQRWKAACLTANEAAQPEPAAPDLAAIRLEAHEHGVKCMAESLRKILDGEPCEASVPPELAEVATRLAAPSVAPEPVAFNSGQVLAILGAAHPPRAPLTRREIESVMMEHYPLDCLLRENVDAFEACVRDLEAAHGISAALRQEQPT